MNLISNNKSSSENEKDLDIYDKVKQILNKN